MAAAPQGLIGRRCNPRIEGNGETRDSVGCGFGASPACRPGGACLHAGQRFYFLNVLEELDEPGEWHLDRAAGILYFWPPAPVGEGKARVSVLEQPMVSMRDVQHVLTDKDPLFVDASRGDFRLKAESPALKMGFKQIPMAKIGLERDEYRTRLPAGR
jgi:hypothetical protein